MPRLFGECLLKGREKARERRGTALWSVENGKTGRANTKRTVISFEDRVVSIMLYLTTKTTTTTIRYLQCVMNKAT